MNLFHLTKRFATNQSHGQSSLDFKAKYFVFKFRLIKHGKYWFKMLSIGMSTWMFFLLHEYEMRMANIMPQRTYSKLNDDYHVYKITMFIISSRWDVIHYVNLFYHVYLNSVHALH